MKQNNINIDGEGNITLQDINNSTVTLNINQFTVEQEKRIKELRTIISDKEEILKIKGQLFDLEINELNKKLEKVLKEKEYIDRQVRNLAKELSKIDLSQASNLYKEAYSAFINGKIDKALDILDDAKLEMEEKKVEELNKQNSNNRLLKAEMLNIKLEFDSAKKNFEKSVALLPMFKNLSQYGHFMQEQLQFYKAADLYAKSISYSQSWQEQLIAHHNIAICYSKINDFDNAIIYYNKCKGIYDKNRKIQSAVTEKGHVNYLQSQLNLALIFIQLKRVQEVNTIVSSILEQIDFFIHNAKTAGQFFLTRLIMFKRVDDTRDNYILSTLFPIKGKCLLIKSSMEPTQRLVLSNDALNIYKELYNSTKSVEYYHHIGLCYMNIGGYYFKSRDFQSSYLNYNNAIEIFRDLNKQHPFKYLDTLANSLLNMFDVLNLLGKKEEGPKLINEFLIINETIFNLNPQENAENYISILYKHGYNQQLNGNKLLATKMYKKGIEVTELLPQYVKNPEQTIQQFNELLNMVNN